MEGEIHRRAKQREDVLDTRTQKKETKGEERREEEKDPPTTDLSRNVLPSCSCCVRFSSQKLLGVVWQSQVQSGNFATNLVATEAKQLAISVYE